MRSGPGNFDEAQAGKFDEAQAGKFDEAQAGKFDEAPLLSDFNMLKFQCLR